MTTREAIVARALTFDGIYDGHGYDCPNRFSHDLGRAAEAWCDDFVTDVYRLEGLPIPSCQPGEVTGSSYVPDFWEEAKRRHARIASWEVKPADPVIFHWPGGNPDGDHIELGVWWRRGALRTVGGNSGPSNVNHFTGRGGVHQHDWSAPHGAGNSVILGGIDAAKFVNFGGPRHVIQAQTQQSHPRPLSLKTPHLKGHDVLTLQRELNHFLNEQAVREDGSFGPATRAALIRAQHQFQDSFGVCREHTRRALGIH